MILVIFMKVDNHFITLLMFVLNFVLFFKLFTLVMFMVDNILSHG